MPRTESAQDQAAALLARAHTAAPTGAARAAEIALQAALFADGNNLQTIAAEAYHCSGDYFQRSGRYEQAVPMFERAIILAENDGNRGQMGRSLCGLGICAMARGEREEARGMFERARLLFVAIGDRSLEAMALCNLSTIAEMLGDHALRGELLHKGLQLAESGIGPRVTIGLRNNLGNLYSDLGEYGRAREELESVIEIARTDHNCIETLVAALNNLGRIHFNNSEFAEAEAVWKEALDLARTGGFEESEAKLMGKLAFLCIGRGDHDMGHQLLVESLDRLTKLECWNEVGNIDEKLGQAAMERGDAASAVDHYLAALEISDRTGNAGLRRWVCSGLPAALEAIGKPELALQYFRTFHELDRELRSSELLKTIGNLQAIRELERLRSQSEINRLRTEQLQHQLEMKQQELASQAITMARQTELLGKFRNELRGILREADKAETAIKRVKEKLQELPCEAIDWPKFEAEFQGTYPDFRDKLFAKYPELSKMEVRICSLIRLKLTSVDIATLFCLSERTVEDHRYRIRKKLGLTREQDIYGVLARI